MTKELSIENIGQKIHVVRGIRVILDSDLAELVDVNTKVLNQAVQRNLDLFRPQYMFQLDALEWESLKFNLQEGRLHRNRLPKVFTGEGVFFLAAVLKTERVIQVAGLIAKAIMQRLNPNINLNLAKKVEDHDREIKELRRLLEQSIHLQQIRGPITVPLPEPPQTAQGVYAVPPSDAPSTASNATGSAPKIIEDPTIDRRSRSLIETIIKVVANYYGLKVQDLKKVTRRQKIVLPRQIAMYLIRTHTKLGFKDIGEFLGGKDHTTILHAVQKIEKSFEENSAIREAIENIEKLIRN